MSNPPQMLSVKRKRNELPVDALVFENTTKRQRNQSLDKRLKPSSNHAFYFRRLTRPDDAPPRSSEIPLQSTERIFHLDNTEGTGCKRVFIEERLQPTDGQAVSVRQSQVGTPESIPGSTPPPRKRPGAGSAIRDFTPRKPQQQPQPTEEEVQKLEALSQQLEKEDNEKIQRLSTSKYKPKPPAQRFADRHPKQAAASASPEANRDDMDIDTNEYVIDTYVREAIIPDGEGRLSRPAGNIGFLVINDSDEEWWNGSDESDKDLQSDGEDENAEDYYANDYPEDEISEDDEFGRNIYQKSYRHGSDDEQYNLDDEEDDDDALVSGDDEDDLHFKMTVPKTQRGEYWGIYGE